ncbi:hypothetical protein ABPG72_003552 [Tetrahymena utriculariae]
MKRSSSQNPDISLDQRRLNSFLVNQNALRIVSPYKQVQRKTLGFHNLNVLSIRNCSGHNQLFLSKDASPIKKRVLNTQASTIRSELIIQSTQKDQQEVLKNFKRIQTPLNQSKRNIHIRSISSCNLSMTKQESAAPTKVNNQGLDSSRGMITFSTNFQNTPKTANTSQIRRSESLGFRNSDNLNSQVQNKINEYENLNSKIQDLQYEKQSLQDYLERIKKEIANEKFLIQISKDNTVKYNRENNSNIASNDHLAQEQLYKSLQIQKTLQEINQTKVDQDDIKQYNSQILEQIENEKLLIEQLKGEIYQNKKEQLDMAKQKEKILKDLQIQHNQMICIEKKYIDKARLQNQILHKVNTNCLTQEFLDKNNIQIQSASSKNIISLSQINEDNDKQDSLILKNDHQIPSLFKSNSKNRKKNENTIQFSLEKNQTNSYSNDMF